MITFQHDVLILDASTVICLYASGKMADILRDVPPQITVAGYVAQHETQYISSPADASGQKQKIPIDLSPIIREGLINIVDPQGEQEAKIQLSLAARIRGMGEVVTGAIAISRNWGIVVDDRKARRLFYEMAPQIQLLYTLDLVKNWIDIHQPDHEEILEALNRIREGAAFVPGKQDPNHAWWEKILNPR